ncbi:hypothetical protein [Mesobacillus sp.]|uniref:hypothetical protein n=1 Tax=Mesobacillus sp. TaxID=2675271 RepID=UPI0039EEAF1D
MDLEIDFNIVKTSMKKGEKYSQTLSGVNLEKGKYDAYVQTSHFSAEEFGGKRKAVPKITPERLCLLFVRI